MASPIKRIKKPQPQRRDNPVTPEAFSTILARYRENDPFPKLLEFAWHSGCRPYEAKHIETRHVHVEAECIVIPKEQAKEKRRARVILLHGRALEIIAQLLVLRPRGKLFLNEDGKPRTRFAGSHRFNRMHLALGIDALKSQGISIPSLPRFNRRAFVSRPALIAARKEHQEKLRERRKKLLILARQQDQKFGLVDTRHVFASACWRMGPISSPWPS